MTSADAGPSKCHSQNLFSIVIMDHNKNDSQMWQVSQKRQKQRTMGTPRKEDPEDDGKFPESGLGTEQRMCREGQGDITTVLEGTLWKESGQR